MYTLLFLPLYYFPLVVDTPATWHTCATSHATPVSLCNCSLMPLALIGPINLSHHQTSFVYGMYRWSTDLTVMFSFLDWSLSCFSDDYFFFWLLICQCDTQQLCSVTWLTLMQANQSPAIVPCSQWVRGLLPCHHEWSLFLFFLDKSFCI